jgi:hypothetical protein
MSTEVWKPIVGLEDCGFVSNMGRIQNRHGKIRKTNVANNGYERVGFHGGQTTIAVHRLVARAFCEGYEDHLQVNHKDGNKLNNTAQNLEWISGSKNCKHAFDLGLTTSSRRKLTTENVFEAQDLLQSGVKLADVARKFGVYPSTVNRRIAAHQGRAS